MLNKDTVSIRVKGFPYEALISNKRFLKHYITMTIFLN